MSVRWRLSRSTLVLVTAVGTSVWWLGGTALGLHPDGAILGFAGTMWMIWATSEQEERKRWERRHRDEPGNWFDEAEQRRHQRQLRRRGQSEKDDNDGREEG